MKWISVAKRIPEEGQQVLVIGVMHTELFEEYPKRIGLVNWKSADGSECSDTCNYTMTYSRITHWMPIEPIEF